jgi:hypothetical protein
MLIRHIQEFLNHLNLVLELLAKTSLFLIPPSLIQTRLGLGERGSGLTQSLTVSLKHCGKLTKLNGIDDGLRHVRPLDELKRVFAPIPILVTIHGKTKNPDVNP